jgi:hypothetical protein
MKDFGPRPARCLGLLVVAWLGCVAPYAPACAAEPTATPAAADADAQMSLSPSQLMQLLKVVNARGTPIKLPPQVATMLKLEPASIDNLQQVMYEDAQGTRHGFAPLSDHTGYFMVRHKPGADHIVFHVDSGMKLVKAAGSLTRVEGLIELPPQQARHELNEEIAKWAQVLTPTPAPNASSKAAAPLNGGAPGKLKSTAPPATAKP